MSECINPNTPFALFLLLEKVALKYLPSTHLLHISSCSVLRTGTPIIVSLSILSAPWCQCPIHLCHSSFSSFSPLRLLPISATGDLSCNLYSLLLRAPICLFLFQLGCLTHAFFPMKYTLYPLSYNGDTEIRFIPNPGTCSTLVARMLVPSFVENSMVPLSTRVHFVLFPIVIWKSICSS